MRKPEITTDGKAIFATIDFNYGGRAQGPNWAKKVAGARWHGESKRWRYPLTMETCWSFRRVFGADLQVTEVLSAWARQELSRRDNLEVFRDEVAEQAVKYLDRVRDITPDLFLAISSRPYQLAGAAFQITSKGCILGDQPGLGKTLQTIATIVQHGGQDILVACPRTATRAVWERETRRWAPHIHVFVAQGDAKTREQAIADYQASDGPRMLIVNNIWSIAAKRVWLCKLTEEEHTGEWAAPLGRISRQPVINGVIGWPRSYHQPGTKLGCRSDQHKHDIEPEPNVPFLLKHRWDIVVMDESHKALASTKNVGAKGISQARYGAMQIRARIWQDGLALALSGTPARSKLDKFWGTLNWVDPKTFASYWRFAETHFEVTHDGWGQTVGTLNEHGRRVAVPKDPELFDRTLRPYYLARTKDKVAADLPPIAYAGSPPAGSEQGMNCIWVEPEAKQAKAYADMAKMATVKLPGGTLLANGTLAEITRLRQLANAYGHLDPSGKLIPEEPSAKLEWVMEFLQQREGNDGKVIIASSFTEIVDWVTARIAAEYGWDYVRSLTGSTTDRQRLELVEDFQDTDSPLRVVVLNSDAGGEAITLDAADDVIAFDLPWTSDQWEQVEARAHRVSRIHQVTVYRLATLGTIDEWMASLTDEQRAIMYAAKPEARAKMIKEAMAA